MIGFFTGLWGKLAAAGAILAAIAVAVLRFAAINKKAGVDQQKAKEADARAENFKRIREAQEAGRAARAGPAPGMPDPNDRDAQH